MRNISIERDGMRDQEKEKTNEKVHKNKCKSYTQLRLLFPLPIP